MEHTNQMGTLYLVITRTKFLQLMAPKFQGLPGHNEWWRRFLASEQMVTEAYIPTGKRP